MKVPKGPAIAGSRFALVGRFSVYQYVVKDLIESAGGIVVEYIDHTTDYVVVGDDAAGKKAQYMHKAKQIISEDYLEAMLRGVEARTAKIEAQRQEMLNNQDYGAW